MSRTVLTDMISNKIMIQRIVWGNFCSKIDINAGIKSVNLLDAPHLINCMINSPRSKSKSISRPWSRSIPIWVSAWNISQLHLNYEYQSTTKMSYQSTILMPHQFSRVFTEVETFRQKWHIRIIHILREI